MANQDDTPSSTSFEMDAKWRPLEAAVLDLEHRKNQLQEIIDTVEAAIWIRNKAGEYEYMNQNNRDLFNIADDVDIVGKQITDLLSAEVAKKFLENDQRVYETGEPIEIEETVQTVDGPRDYLTRIVPLVEEGSVYATCGIATDVTEQQRRERQLEEFATIVSHDLRNPLNVAQGRLEMAMKECESDHLEDVAEAHDRMRSLIDDMLRLAREGGEISETESVNIVDLVRACWDSVETKDATIQIETAQTIRADKNRLKQVFENLFRNAIDHGSDDVRITIGDIPDGIFIRDNGPGIPCGERLNVFDAGYSTCEDSTGFGLSIVREVIRAHGWSIDLMEGKEGGTRFEISGVECI